MQKIRFIASILLIAVFSMVYSHSFAQTNFAITVPELPDYLDFAGERVPLELPDVRQAVQREVLTTSNMHTATMLTLLRSRRWIPVIKPILEDNGIPSDFIYLCLAESGMNPEAISTAKAAGMWQFMAAVAKDYKLETGPNIDMRYNVEQATKAACKYLKQSYDTLGSWTLAAACYNLGNAGVKRRLARQEVSSYWDLYLPQETMRYVSRILSFKLLLSNPEKYGFVINEDEYFKPFENYMLVSISDAQINWCKLAKTYGTNYKILRLLNPWIREYSFENKAGKNYTVKIPNENFRKKGF